MFKYDDVEQFPSHVNISSQSSVEKHSSADNTSGQFTTARNFHETVSDMFADSSDRLSDVSSENVGEQPSELQSSRLFTNSEHLASNHSSLFELSDDNTDKGLAGNIRTLEDSRDDGSVSDEDNSSVGISDSESKNSRHRKIESNEHWSNSVDSAQSQLTGVSDKSSIKEPDSPVVNEIQLKLQNGVCRENNFRESSQSETQNSVVQDERSPISSEMSSHSENDSFELTSHSSETNRRKSKLAASLEGGACEDSVSTTRASDGTPDRPSSADDGTRTRLRMSLKLKPRKTFREISSQKQPPLPTILDEPSHDRNSEIDVRKTDFHTSERSTVPCSSNENRDPKITGLSGQSFTPDSSTKTELGPLTSGALSDKGISSNGKLDSESSCPEGRKCSGEREEATVRREDETEGERNSCDRVDDFLPDFEERVVLPGGKKYRRSMSIVRQLAEEDLILPSVDQRQLNRTRYSSKFESVIGVQLAGKINWMGDLEGAQNALENVSRRLSILNLNCENQVANTAGLLPKPVRNNRISRTHFDFPVKESEDTDYKELLLGLCKQDDPCSFGQLVGDGSLEKCRKIGEGVFGEVFILDQDGRNNVLKIIPIEGDFKVNGEPQKRYSEVYSELIISFVLDSLRNEGKDWMSSGFMEMKRSWLIEGRYPDRLVQLWDQYDELKGSENDSPEIFKDDQLYLVLELGNGGTDLENYKFSTASQALSVFKQVVCSLAVAESAFEFEHRDLHWGNVLVSKSTERSIEFTLNGETYGIKTVGVKGTIIDYTLSSIKVSNKRIYNDIGKDPEMFTATGDYQFDIYRHMKEDVGNNWELFVPKTNVRWLHYLVDKMINNVCYMRKTAKVHKDCMKQLKDIESWILDCDNSVQVALNIVS